MNGLNDLSVLVVEHDPWTRSHLSTALYELGVQVAQASNGMTALRLALATAPHVMMLGPSLPELSPADLVLALRSEPQTHHTAIVDIQGSVDSDATLVLPCTAFDILASVVDALEARHQAVVATPIRSVIASPRTWPSVEVDSSRSNSRIRNRGRSGKWRLSSGIETL